MRDYLFLTPFIALGMIFIYNFFDGFYGGLHIKETRKERRLFKNIFIAILPFLAINILFPLSHIFSKVKNYSYSVTLQEFANDLNNYSDLIVSLSTLILLIATIVYVILTNKIIKETREAKLIEIRPIIYIKLKELVQNEKGEISGSINIQNFSKSYILDSSIDFSDLSNEITPEIFLNNVRSFAGIERIEPLKTETVKFSGLIYSEKEYSFKLKIKYYDVQRNFYEYIAYLRNADESIYFRIDQETLIMTPYNKRQFKVFSNPKVVIFENINKKLPKENWELYEKFL